MRFDVALPSVLFMVSAASLLLYVRHEKRIRTLFRGQRLRAREAVLMVLAMGLMITIIAFILQQAIMILCLFSYSAILYLFAYLTAPKWYLESLLNVFVGSIAKPAPYSSKQNGHTIGYPKEEGNEQRSRDKRDNDQLSILSNH